MPRLLTIGHSYVVAQNRRLAHEMAKVGTGSWEVRSLAPSFMHGDLRPIYFEEFQDDASMPFVEPVRLTRWPHLLHYSGKTRQIVNQDWDLVHVWEEPFVLAGYQLSRMVSKPTKFVFLTFQNLAKWYPPPFSWFESHVVNRCDGWVAFANTVHETAMKKPAYSSKPNDIIPVGVDTKSFHHSPELGVFIKKELGWADVSSKPVIGFLGRFVPEKGIGLIQNLLDDLPIAWRALFVGGGPLEFELRNWAKRHGDSVRVVTGVPHNEVNAYLNAMDVLLAPSRTTPGWREQFGRMIIEAFAAGVPVIGSDSGEIPFVIRDCGLIANELDLMQWKSALLYLLDSPKTIHELKEKGIAKANDEFSWRIVANRHMQFISQIISI